MAWVTEDSPNPLVESPLGEAQCGPCIALFNPVFITGNQTFIDIDADSHLNHYIVQTTNDFTFVLRPAVKDSVDYLGIVVLMTRDTESNMFIDDSNVELSIYRGLPQADAKGDTLGLISVKSTQYVIAGGTRLVA